MSHVCPVYLKMLPTSPPLPSYFDKNWPLIDADKGIQIYPYD